MHSFDFHKIKIEHFTQSNFNKEQQRKLFSFSYQDLKQHRIQFYKWHKKQQKQRRKIRYKIVQFIEKKKKKNQKQFRQRFLFHPSPYSYDRFINEMKQIRIQRIKSIFREIAYLFKNFNKVLIHRNSIICAKFYQKKNIQIQQDFLEVLSSQIQFLQTISNKFKEEITKQSSYLIGITLYDFQLKGLAWLISLFNNKFNGILADESGLGKTVQVISMICHIMESKNNFGPFLIIAPLICISIWVDQFVKYAPQIRKIVYVGDLKKRKQIIRQMNESKWNVCIISYENAAKDRLKLNKYDWKSIFIDEAHRLRNQNSKHYTIFGSQYNCHNKILLTGNPLQNNLLDLCSLFTFLYPQSQNIFKQYHRLIQLILNKNQLQLENNQISFFINKLQEAIRPFILRRTKAQVLPYLPSKIVKNIKLELSGWQNILYDNTIQRQLPNYMRINQLDMVNTQTNNILFQLQKICNNPFLVLKNNYSIQQIIYSSSKFLFIDLILPKLFKFNHRVLIFTRINSSLDLMAQFLSYRKIKYLCIDSSLAYQQRCQYIHNFNAPNSQYTVLLLSTYLCKESLNLQTADTVILLEPSWNPQTDIQAQDRVHRIGQLRQVLILRLITKTPFEEVLQFHNQYITSKANKKLGINKILIEGGLYNMNSSIQNQRKQVENMIELLKQQRYEDDQFQMTDNLINLYLMRSQQQYQQFTRMDQISYFENNKLLVSTSKFSTFLEYLIKGDQIPHVINTIQTNLNDQSEDIKDIQKQSQ